MKNKLSIWTYSYTKKYYLTHPFKWVHETYWNTRNYFHRAKYGYAYVDVWNWFDWWTKVGAEALRYLAKHNSAYPGVEPWETPEKWDNYLYDVADDLEKAGDSCEFLFADQENEYSEQMKNLHRNKSYIKSDEEKEIVEKYMKREEEISKYYEEWRAKIFAEIGKNLPRFWD